MPAWRSISQAGRMPSNTGFTCVSVIHVKRSLAAVPSCTMIWFSSGCSAANPTKSTYPIGEGRSQLRHVDPSQIRGYSTIQRLDQ